MAFSPHFYYSAISHENQDAQVKLPLPGTSCASTTSAMKNSVSVSAPMKVNPMISLMDEIALCSMIVLPPRAFQSTTSNFTAYTFPIW